MSDNVRRTQNPLDRCGARFINHVFTDIKITKAVLRHVSPR